MGQGLFPLYHHSEKWHTAQRNLQVGDIVINQDSNRRRGNWKSGIVSTVKPGVNVKVRNVEVKYKNLKPNEPAGQNTCATDFS